MEIKIIAEDLKSDELLKLINEKANIEQVQFKTVPLPDQSKALDLNELLVVGKELLPYVSLVISSLVAIYTAKMKTKSATVKVEYSKDKIVIEADKNTKPELIEERLKMAKDQLIEKIKIYKA